jgi:hypothetical protein
MSDEEDDQSPNTGQPEEWKHRTCLKPSWLDGAELDGEVEIVEDLPYGAGQEVNTSMVDMMASLDDCDARDLEWLPLKEQRKLDERKKGMSNDFKGLMNTYLCPQGRGRRLLMVLISPPNRNAPNDACTMFL